jgi:hypothetical protein
LKAFRLWKYRTGDNIGRRLMVQLSNPDTLRSFAGI